jgi:hypothetical protein
MDQNEIPHDPRHPGVSSGASKTIISLWYVRRKLCTYLSSWLALSPNRLNRASTWASSPRSTIRCVQNEFLWLCYVWQKIVHLSCTDTYTVLKHTKRDSTWPMSPRSCIKYVQNDFRTSGTFSANRAPILRQDHHYLETDWNELPLEPHNLGVPSGASKMISKLMVPLAQRIHLSCTNTNTVSK